MIRSAKDMKKFEIVATSPEDDRQSARLRRTLVHASGLIQRLVAEVSQPDVIERCLGHSEAILPRIDHQQPRPLEV